MKPLAFNPHARLARARSFALLMGMLLLWSPCAFALNPLLPVAEYGHAVWKRGETVPSHIYAIAQTSDGYLWLGCEAGLFQFDGVKFLHWEPPSGQPLPATRIQTLLVTRDDALWIGTSNGLAKWRDGTLKVYPELSGVPVTT